MIRRKKETVRPVQIMRLGCACLSPVLLFLLTILFFPSILRGKNERIVKRKREEENWEKMYTLAAKALGFLPTLHFISYLWLWALGRL